MKEIEMSEDREFNHWFWNSAFMDAFAQALAKFDAWIFSKQCGY
jgi:hypothetical protein